MLTDAEINQIVFLKDLAVIKISGKKTQEFLQGQMTCDVLTATEEKIIIGAACNHQGRILAICFLMRSSEDYLCILPKDISTSFIQHLNKYAVFSKVSIVDVSIEYYLYGWLGDRLPDYLKHLANAFLLKGFVTRYLILSREKLNAKGAPNDTLWKLMDIYSGLPTIHLSTVGKVTPHMVDLQLLGGVSFSKGCYVGQEIIARTQYLGKSKKHLCRAEMEGMIEMSEGETIFSDSQESGWVINTVNYQEITYLLVVLQEPIDRSFLLKGQPLLRVSRCHRSDAPVSI
jgi:folate-binding protein YgfZ